MLQALAGLLRSATDRAESEPVIGDRSGATAGTAPSPFELGPDPAAQFQQPAAAMLAAWRTPGVLDKIVDAGAGPMPGRVLAGINLLDTAHLGRRHRRQWFTAVTI